MLSVICDSDSRRSHARLTNQKAREISFFKYPNPGGANGSLDVEGQDGVRAAIEWRKLRQSKESPPFGGGRGGKGGASGNAELPLSTSGVDRMWCGARSAHNSVCYDISCESS